MSGPTRYPPPRHPGCRRDRVWGLLLPVSRTHRPGPRGFTPMPGYSSEFTRTSRSGSSSPISAPSRTPAPPPSPLSQPRRQPNRPRRRAPWPRLHRCSQCHGNGPGQVTFDRHSAGHIPQEVREGDRQRMPCSAASLVPDSDFPDLEACQRAWLAWRRPQVPRPTGCGWRWWWWSIGWGRSRGAQPMQPPSVCETGKPCRWRTPALGQAGVALAPEELGERQLQWSAPHIHCRRAPPGPRPGSTGVLDPRVQLATKLD